MKLISLGYVHNDVIRQYGRHKQLRYKINNFFSNFLDTYNDFGYVWYEDKLYFDASHGWRIKKDIENLLNKSINKIYPKWFSPDMKVRFINGDIAKKKLARKDRKKKNARDKKRKKIRSRFEKSIRNIKGDSNDCNHIGCFDLEFWEHDSRIILEFGWRIENYETGVGETCHYIVQENLNYENKQYAISNKFERKDSRVMPLHIIEKKFKEDFLSTVDVLVGHGLCNDFRVLKQNGMNLNRTYLDTAEIGAVLMYEEGMVSLERLLEHLRIKSSGLHNAANDAEYTLKAFFEMGDL